MIVPVTDRGGRRPVVESDVVAVGRYVEAEELVVEARQRMARAADALEAVQAPVRQLDADLDAAVTRLHDLNLAADARAAWTEAVAGQRDAIGRQVADRAAARGRGPAAWAARERLSRSAYEVPAARERAAELGQAMAGAVERVGVDDPQEWPRLREEASETIRSYSARREVVVAAAQAARPGAVARLDAERQRQADAEAARAQAAAVLEERGLDVDRVREALLQGMGRRAPGAAVDDRTEAALGEWARRREADRAFDVDVDQGGGGAGPPEPRQDVER